MNILNSNIKPYEGLDEIKLYDSLNDVINYLNQNNIKYETEIWKAEQETIPNPWTVIFIENCINLYFASNNKLFKIFCTTGFKGSLPNGIKIGTSLQETRKIDNTLKYIDDNEDYESINGYWIEDDLDTGEVLSISIFIKEVLDENTFDSLKW